MPTVNPTTINYYGATDTGRLRTHNEDCFVTVDLTGTGDRNRGVVLMIADGMGGANAGEVAADIACRVVRDRFSQLKASLPASQDPEKYLKNLLDEAHRQIVAHAHHHPECRGMGTTAVIAWLLDGYLHVVWCGDSRCYVYQKHQQFTLTPFTDDHSLVWQMVQDGELSPEEARVHPQSNMILQVLGGYEAPPAPTYAVKKLVAGEQILLCSDGLNGMLSDARMQQLLEQEVSTDATVSALIETANQAGGYDNITVVLAEVGSMTDHSAVDTPAPVKDADTSSRRRWSWPWSTLFATLLYTVASFA